MKLDTNLYYIIVALALLLITTAVMRVRVYLYLRRTRERIQEAIANGTWVPPAGSQPVDLGKKPNMFEVHLDVEEPVGSVANGARVEKEDITQGPRGYWKEKSLEGWERIVPFSVIPTSTIPTDSIPTTSMEDPGSRANSNTRRRMRNLGHELSLILGRHDYDAERAISAHIQENQELRQAQNSRLQNHSRSQSRMSQSQSQPPPSVHSQTNPPRRPSSSKSLDLDPSSSSQPTMRAAQIAVLIAMPSPIPLHHILSSSKQSTLSPGTGTHDAENPLPHLEFGISNVDIRDTRRPSSETDGGRAASLRKEESHS